MGFEKTNMKNDTVTTIRPGYPGRMKLPLFPGLRGILDGKKGISAMKDGTVTGPGINQYRSLVEDYRKTIEYSLKNRISGQLSDADRLIMELNSLQPELEFSETAKDDPIQERAARIRKKEAEEKAEKDRQRLTEILEELTKIRSLLVSRNYPEVTLTASESERANRSAVKYGAGVMRRRSVPMDEHTVPRYDIMTAEELDKITGSDEVRLMIRRMDHIFRKYKGEEEE